MPYALTVELDDETAQALDRLAEQTDRTRESLVNEAVRDYLALEASQLAEIADAIKEADRGEFVTREEIERIIGKYDSAS